MSRTIRCRTRRPYGKDDSKRCRRFRQDEDFDLQDHRPRERRHSRDLTLAEAAAREAISRQDLGMRGTRRG